MPTRDNPTALNFSVSPFQILAAGDRNTAALFDRIDRQTAQIAQRQERSLDRAFRMFTTVEQLRQNQQRIDQADRRLNFEAALSGARIELDRAKSIASLERDAVLFAREDRKFKTDMLKQRAELLRKKALSEFFRTNRADALEAVDDQILKEFDSLDSTPGSLDGMSESINRIKKSGDAALNSFGGIPIDYNFSGAVPSVFGGTLDPADNGLSAYGGRTGPGGKSGVAIPQRVMAALGIKGKDAESRTKVRIKTRLPDGSIRETIEPVVDRGTAEWTWRRAGSPVLDFTENALARAGGKVRRNSKGQMIGVTGIDSVDFEIIPPGQTENSVSGFDLPSGAGDIDSALFGTGLEGSPGPRGDIGPAGSLDDISEAQADEIINGSFETAARNEDVYIPQSREEALEFERKVHMFVDDNNQKAAMISRMRRLSPAYQEDRNAVFSTLAALDDASVTITESDDIDRLRSNYTSFGGNAPEFDSFLQKVLQRNKLNARIANANDAIIKLATTTSEQGQVLAQDQIPKINEQIKTLEFQRDSIETEINKIANVPELPQQEPEQPLTPGEANKRFFGLGEVDDGGIGAAALDRVREESANRSVSELADDLSNISISNRRVASEALTANSDVPLSQFNSSRINFGELPQAVKDFQKLAKGRATLDRRELFFDDKALDSYIRASLDYFNQDPDTLTDEDLASDKLKVASTITSIANKLNDNEELMRAMGMVMYMEATKLGVKGKTQEPSRTEGSLFGFFKHDGLDFTRATKDAKEVLTRALAENPNAVKTIVPIYKTAKTLLEMEAETE